MCVEQRPSHLPGATNVSHDEVGARAPECCLTRTQRSSSPAPAGVPDSGIAANRLAALGYTNVRGYHESKAEWVDAGLPVEGEARAAA